MKGKRQEEDLKDLKISSSHLLVNNLATGCLKMLCVCVLKYSNSGFLFLIHGPPLVEFSKSLFSAVFHCAKFFKPHYSSPIYALGKFFLYLHSTDFLSTCIVQFWKIFGYFSTLFKDLLYTAILLFLLRRLYY